MSPVLAEDSAAFVECKQIKGDLKGKKNCFKRLARELEAAVNTAAKDLETLQAAADKAEADKVKLQAVLDNTEKMLESGELKYEGQMIKDIWKDMRDHEFHRAECTGGSNRKGLCEADLEMARSCASGYGC